MRIPNEWSRKIREALPKGIRDWMRWNLVPRDSSWTPAVIPKADAERIVVLSPHPDDDVIGCGGTLRKHCLSGDSVTVIYLTNGARGMDHTAPPCPETAARRRSEAEQAAAVIGIRDLVFWDIPDGELSSAKGTIPRLLLDLEKADPQAVFLPFVLDGHRDHRATNRIFASAVRRQKKAMKVYAYEIWSPVPSNCIVDISAVIREKEEAIGRHRSQTANRDYAAAVLGLNRFRSISVAGPGGFFEAFLALDAARYAGLVEQTLQFRL